jgi:hypothetical protein
MTGRTGLRGMADPAYPEYGTVRHKATKTRPRFVDQAYINTLTAIVRTHGPDWCTAVLGYPFTGLNTLPPVDAHMLYIADQMALTPPLPDRIVRQRREQQALRDEQARLHRQERHRQGLAWDTARQQCAVPDVLTVRPNRNSRRHISRLGHLDGPNRHVVPTVTVYSGTPQRPRTHQAGRALCETTRRQPMDLGDPVDDPPICVRCLKWVRLIWLPA